MSVTSPVPVMAHADTSPMTSQIYATNMTPSLQGSGLNLIQPNVMWRPPHHHHPSHHVGGRYNAPMHPPQFNGRGGIYGANGPVYVSNMPMSMVPMMNGGPFIRPSTNRYELHDRYVEDEGYEDN